MTYFVTNASIDDMKAQSSAAAAALFISAILGNLFAAPGAQAATGLTGHRYISTSVKPRPIPGHGPLIIDFLDNGKVFLTAGCNSMTTSVKTEGGRLRFAPVAATRMMCPPPLDQADGWLDNLMKKSPSYKLSGKTLTMSTKSTTVVLEES